MWDIVIDKPFLNCEKIYPVAQKYVRCIVDCYQDIPSVKRIIIFGSATEWRFCFWRSDVDVYIDGDDDRYPYPDNPYSRLGYDIWYPKMIHGDAARFLKEVNKGVIVYERDVT